MVYICPKCDKKIARDNHPRAKRLVPYLLEKDVILKERMNEAPRLVCPCGGKLILLKGQQ